MNWFKYGIIAFRNNIITILMVVVLIWGLGAVTDSSGTSMLGGEIVALGWIVFMFHKSILFGERDSFKSLFRKSRSPGKRFWFGFAGLFLSTIGLGLFAIIPLVQSFSSSLNAPDIRVIALLSVAIMNWIVLSLFGTILPAAVMARGEGFSAAFKRGKQTFFFVASRLLLGPGLLALLVALLQEFAFRMGYLSTDFDAVTGAGPASVLTYLGFQTLSWLVPALTAGVLSAAYLRQLPEAEPANAS